MVVVGERAEDAVPDFEHLQAGFDISLLKTTFVHGRVSVAHKIKHGGECAGRVQIVVHGLFEFLFRLRRSAVQVGIFAGGEGFLLQTVLKIPQSFQGLLRLMERVEGEVQLLPMRHRRQQVANRARLGAVLQQVAQGEEIPRRLGHLLSFHQKMLDVHPGADERLAGETLALGDFILMVRENQIRASGMDVETLPQVFHRHDGAFKMPARTSASKGGVPAGLAGLRCLPEDEVAHVVLFVFVLVHPCSRFHAGQVDSRKASVGREA